MLRHLLGKRAEIGCHPIFRLSGDEDGHYYADLALQTTELGCMV